MRASVTRGFVVRAGAVVAMGSLFAGGCYGTLTLPGTNAEFTRDAFSVDFPGGTVNLSDDGLFVDFPGGYVNASEDGVFVQTPGVHVDIH